MTPDGHDTRGLSAASGAFFLAVCALIAESWTEATACGLTALLLAACAWRDFRLADRPTHHQPDTGQEPPA